MTRENRTDGAAGMRFRRANTLEGEAARKATGPSPLGQALSQLIALRGLARVRGEPQLAAVWAEIAGPAIAPHTKVMGINRGVLQVAVSSAALLSELASFHKASLLSAFKEKQGHLKVRDMKFRLKGDLAR